MGSFLARSFRSLGSEVVVLDNLRRRGAELNLADFQSLGISFQHGDIRSASDLDDLPGQFDLLVEASAEPSVHSGLTGSPCYVLGANLTGTLNCLEFARRRAGAMLFLSTSRVYSIRPLLDLPIEKKGNRFVLPDGLNIRGISSRGITEAFPTESPRSFYGASKLASELVAMEYAFAYGMKIAINRCGVIAGPGQFGKVDQGVFTLWVANHHFRKSLQYSGFGGLGLQVRDLLHPRDLFLLMQAQLAKLEAWNGDIFNVGGELGGSVSLREMTDLCQEVSGNSIEITSNPSTASVDIPYYVSDCAKVEQKFGWKPSLGPRAIVSEIYDWIRKNETMLRPIFG